MDGRQSIIDRIQEDLVSNESMLSACLDIFAYLESQPKDNLRFITFAALSRAAKLEGPTRILPVAQYLAGSRLHLLDTCYLLVDEDDEFDINADEVSEAKKTGVLYHPDDGEPVEDFENKLVVYFSLSKEAFELIGDKA